MSDENKELTAQQEENIVAGKILKEEKKQSRKASVQSIAMVVIACCMMIITVAVVMLIKNINDKINAIYIKADTAVTTMNEVAAGINETDLPGMAEQIKNLTSDATEGISATMEKIDSLDIDALNNSIANLDEATSAFSDTVQAFGALFH